MASGLKFGYWDCRGLGGSVRAFLTHLGLEFEERTYYEGDAPDFSRNDWFAEKFSLDLEWPNLPYLIGPDFQVTNSYTILRVVALKYAPEYLGRTLKEKADAENMLPCLWSALITFTKQLYYPEQFPPSEEADTKVRTFFQNMFRRKGSKRFALGDQPTYVDFYMYEFLAKVRALTPRWVEEFPEIEPYWQAIESLENMGAYIESANKMRFNMKIAHTNNTEALPTTA
jgi:glutathione S-transferase